MGRGGKLKEIDQNQNQTKPRALGGGGGGMRGESQICSLTRDLTTLACLLGPGVLWGLTRTGEGVT